MLALSAGSALLASSSVPELQAQKVAPVDTVRVVNACPHDAAAYTQGLICHEGYLFESTGLHGQSTLRRVKIETGEVVQQHRLDTVYFAEGLTEWNGQLVQLTWRSGIAFVYDLASFAPLRTFTYTGEGWGLTRDRGRTSEMKTGQPAFAAVGGRSRHEPPRLKLGRSAEDE